MDSVPRQHLAISEDVPKSLERRGISLREAILGLSGILPAKHKSDANFGHFDSAVLDLRAYFHPREYIPGSVGGDLQRVRSIQVDWKIGGAAYFSAPTESVGRVTYNNQSV